MNTWFLAIGLWVLTIHFAAWGIGWTMVRLKYLEAPQFLSEAIAYPIVAGYWILGLLILLLGSLQLLYPWVLALVIVIAGINSAVILLRSGRRFIAFPLHIDPFFCIALVFISIHLLNSFNPVWNVDALNYHIALPRIYLENHGISGNAFFLFANMPHNINLLNTLPLLIGDPLGVKVFIFSFFFIMLALIAAFSAKHLARSVFGILAIIYLSLPVTQAHLGRTNIEPAIACFVLFAMTILLDWFHKRSISTLMVGCGIAGWLMGSKYTTWYLCAALFIFIIIAAILQLKNQKKKIAAATMLLCIWASGIVPWLVKNWIITGNPVYPALYDVFGGTAWSSFDTHTMLFYYDNIRGAGWRHYLYPILNLFGFVDKSPGSFILMAFFILALCIPHLWRQGNKYILVTALTGILAFTFGSAYQSRFALVILPFLTASAGLSLSLLASKKWIKLISWLPICFLVIQLPLPSIDWNLLRSKEAYRDKVENFAVVRLWNEINRILPEDAVVYALFDIHTMYYRRDFIKRGSYILREAGDVERAVKQIKLLGAAYLLVNWSRANRYFNMALNAADAGYVEKDIAANELQIFKELVYRKTTLIKEVELDRKWGRITLHEINN